MSFQGLNPFILIATSNKSKYLCCEHLNLKNVATQQKKKRLETRRRIVGIVRIDNPLVMNPGNSMIFCFWQLLSNEKPKGRPIGIDILDELLLNDPGINWETH